MIHLKTASNRMEVVKKLKKGRMGPKTFPVCDDIECTCIKFIHRYCCKFSWNAWTGFLSIFEYIKQTKIFF